MTTRKPKLDKRKHAHTWLERHNGERQVDFDSPMSLEETVEAIETYIPKAFWRMMAGDTYTRVNLTQIDENTYEFRLFQIGYRLIAIRCKGHVHARDLESTQVSASLWPAYEVLLMLLIGVGIFLFQGLFYLNTYSILFYVSSPLIVAVFVAIYVAFAQRMSSEIQDKLKAILHTKDQTKPKKHISPWFERLFGVRRIDFISALSLEECVGRLERVNVGQHWWSRTTSATVEVHPIDEDTYYLKVVKGGRNTRLELVGSVKRWEADTSRIMMNARPQYIEMFFALMLIGFLAVGLAQLSPFLAVFVILPLLFVRILLSEVVSNIQFQLEQYLEKSE